MVNKFIEELLQISSNSKCADCKTNDSTHTSCLFGIFICHKCSEFHRVILFKKSKVLALTSNEFTDNDIKILKSRGNEKSNEIFEKNVPMCYKRPTYNDSLVLMEQWIRGKYERKEFDEHSSTPVYLKNIFEGFLWKRGKDKNKFRARRFVLNKIRKELTYYTSDTPDTEAKAKLEVDLLDIFIQPEKVGNPFGMQIMVEGKEATRSLYVYVDTGEELVNWYTAVYACKLEWKRIAFPSVPIIDFYTDLWPKVMKEGWLRKKGPKSKDTFYLRWVVLVKRKLLYYTAPMDAFPQGEVFIGYQEPYSVRAPVDWFPPADEPNDDNRLSASSSGGSTSNSGASKKDGDKNGEKWWDLVVETPRRVFNFQAKSETIQREWMEVLQALIEQPLSSSDQKLLNRTGVKKVTSKRLSAFLGFK